MDTHAEKTSYPSYKTEHHNKKFTKQMKQKWLKLNQI